MAPKAKPAAAKPAAKPDAKAKPKAESKKKEPKEERPEDLIPKVNQPDEAEFEAKLKAVSDAIEKLQTQKTDLDAKIKERSGGNDEYQVQRQALREELTRWSDLMNEKKNEKDQVSQQLGDRRQEGLAQKDALNKMKKAMPYGTEEEIDKRIATIEFKMMHESVPIREEKKMLAEIQELKKSRPKVAHVHSLEAKVKEDDRGLPLKDRMKQINEDMSQLFEQKKRVSEKLKELNEGRAAATGDLPDLRDKRADVQKQIGEQIQLRNTIRAEKKEQEQAYYNYTLEVRRLRQERAAEERRKRQEEFDVRKRAREADKLDEQPYIAEITLIEQTIAFCKSLTQAKGSQKEEEKKEIKHTNKAEEVVLLKKEDREEEFFFAPTKGKKSKSKSKGADKSEGGSKPIRHDANTFQLFSKLKLDAPITTDDIPALLENLEAQLEDYQGKVKDWEEQKEARKARILAGDEETGGDKPDEEE